MVCLNKRAERKHRSKTAAEEEPEALWVDVGKLWEMEDSTGQSVGHLTSHHPKATRETHVDGDLPTGTY